MLERAAPNSRAALLEQRAAGVLTLARSDPDALCSFGLGRCRSGPGRSNLRCPGFGQSVGRSGCLAAALRALIDGGCLCALWWLTRREGLTLVDLINFDRKRLGRDMLLGLALSRRTWCSSLAGTLRAAYWSTEALMRRTSSSPTPLGVALLRAGLSPALGRYGADDLQRLRPAALAGPVGQHAPGRSCRRLLLVVPAFLPAADVRPDFMLYRLLSPIAFSTSSRSSTSASAASSRWRPRTG